MNIKYLSAPYFQILHKQIWVFYKINFLIKMSFLEIVAKLIFSVLMNIQKH